MFPERFPCALMMLVFSNVFNEEEDEEHCNQNGGLIIITTLLFNVQFHDLEIYLAFCCSPSYDQDLNDLHLTCTGTVIRYRVPIQSCHFWSPTFRCRNVKRGPLVVIAAIWTLPCHQLFHLKAAILWRKCPNKTIQHSQFNVTNVISTTVLTILLHPEDII